MSDTRRTFLARISAVCTAVSVVPATALVATPTQLAPRRRLTEAQESLIRLLRECVCVATDGTIAIESGVGVRRYRYRYRYAPGAACLGLQPRPSHEELAEIGLPVSASLTWLVTPLGCGAEQVDIEVEWIVPGNYPEESSGNHHLHDDRQSRGRLGHRRALGYRA